MKVIKKINNNVAICKDGNNKELIAFGKGIGFLQMPYEIEDMSIITRTFYGVDSNYLALIDEIPEDIFEISAQIVDYAKTVLDAELSANVVFTLADHIQFALIRNKKKMHVRLPIMCDIEHLHHTEMEIGTKAIKYINTTKKVRLPKEEAASIALHFINAQSVSRKTKDSSENIIEDVTSIIEEYFNIQINRNSFNNSRFVSHMQYLLQRQKIDQGILSENGRLFTTMQEEYPKTYDCVLQIRDYLKRELDWESSDEELLYLMLHINRLCSREDCEEK